MLKLYLKKKKKKNYCDWYVAKKRKEKRTY